MSQDGDFNVWINCLYQLYLFNVMIAQGLMYCPYEPQIMSSNPPSAFFVFTESYSFGIISFYFLKNAYFVRLIDKYNSNTS